MFWVPYFIKFPHYTVGTLKYTVYIESQKTTRGDVTELIQSISYINTFLKFK